jgi:hypothetical protein
MSGVSIGRQCVGARYRLWGGAGIGKQCTGAGHNYREEWVLASNALALDTTTGRSGYWQAMSWR